MRVLHIFDHSLPFHSGYAFRSASILREQRALGYTTLQLTTARQNGGAVSSEDVDRLTFHRTPLPPNSLDALPGARYVREIRATAKRLDALTAEFVPDVLHAHSPVLNALPAIWVARRRKLPMVYEVRALWEDAAVDHGTTSAGSIRYNGSRALETWALRRADHVTTICEGLRNEIVGRGISPDRVTVIPNAVDICAFDMQPGNDTTLRTRMNLVGTRVIGFAGSFYGYEGLDLLLDAFAILAPRRPDLRVLLVGGGPQEAALRAQAARLGLGDRVIFTGRVSHDAVRTYYDLIDVLAYPRRKMRLTDLVTPLKPLEAMALGRMFVASDVGGHKELVRHGVNGFLFAADDVAALAQRLEAVLDSEAEWPAIALRARHYVEAERTWTQSVRRYERVYASAVGKPLSISSERAWR